MNTLIAQIRDLFESMTPGARITAGLLLVVAAVSLAYLFQGNVAGPDAFLFGGERFSQSEINRMTAAMAEANITGWEVDSNRISVTQSKQEDCIAAIASAGALPNNFAQFMDQALSQGGPMEGRRQFELRTKTARENQLSLIVSKMPWVESAYVMLDFQERRGFNRHNDASASVFVTPHPGESVDKVRARNIQQFVAGISTSLTADSVQVTSGGNEAMVGSDPWFDDPYLQAREELQKSYKNRILQGLDYIAGVRVEVSAELENMQKRMVKQSEPVDGKPLRTTSELDTEESTIADGGGQPGRQANGPGRNGLDPGLNRQNTKKTSRENGTEEFAVGFNDTVEHYLGFKPKEMYASIAIPRSYVLGVWQQDNPEGDPAELTVTELQTMETSLKIDVERFVQNILPRLALGEDEYRQVEVVFYDSLAPPEIAPPSMVDKATVWAGQYWGTLSMIGLAMFSLLLLRSALKPTSGDGAEGTAAATLQLDLGSESPTSEETDDEQADSERPKLRIKKSDSLKEDLSEMVREDPDAAANILRAWINNAG